MSSPPELRGSAAMSAQHRDGESVPDVQFKLPADRRAAFWARGAIHRLLRDVHPQRRADAARLVGALLDAPITVAAAQPIELSLWRSPRLLEVQLRSTTPLSITRESRLLLDRVAERWEFDQTERAVRFDVRVQMSPRATA